MPESRLLKTGLSAASQGNSSSLPRFLRPGFLLGQIVAQGLGQLPHHSLKRSRIVQSLGEDQSILNRNDTIFSSFTGDRRIHPASTKIVAIVALSALSVFVRLSSLWANPEIRTGLSDNLSSSPPKPHHYL